MKLWHLFFHIFRNDPDEEMVVNNFFEINKELLRHFFFFFVCFCVCWDSGISDNVVILCGDWTSGRLKGNQIFASYIQIWHVQSKA